MDKGVGRDLPKVQIGNHLRAVEGEQVEQRPAPEAIRRQLRIMHTTCTITRSVVT